jgi:TonB-dependent receptor
MNIFVRSPLRARHTVTTLTLGMLAAAPAALLADAAPGAQQASAGTQMAAAGSDQDSTQTDIGRVSTGPATDDTSAVAPSPTRNRAAAIAEKKQAPNLIEVQPLEEIRKLPDINTAEALQRLPGVSLETDTGEGRFVSIRGLDSDLNGTTYGGVRLPPSNPASPFGGGRATAFDVLPTGLIGGIELTKTNRPDLDAEALGGTINLVPRSGDEHGGKLFIEGSAGGGYEALRDTPVFDIDSTVGGSFDGGNGIGGLFAGPRAISVLLTGVYYDDQRGIDDVEAAYSDQQSQGVPDKLLSELDLRRYDYHRQRYGIGGEIDARANEFNRFYLRFLMAGYWEGKQNHHLDISGLDSGCTASTDGGPDDCSAATAKPNPYPSGFFAPANADNGVPEYDQDLTNSKERIQNTMLVLGGSSIAEGVKFDYRTSVAQGTDRLPYSYKGKFVNPNPVGTAYDNVTDPRYPLFQTTDGTDPADPTNYQLNSIGFTESCARSGICQRDRCHRSGGLLAGIRRTQIRPRPASAREEQRSVHRQVQGERHHPAERCGCRWAAGVLRQSLQHRANTESLWPDRPDRGFDDDEEFRRRHDRRCRSVSRRQRKRLRRLWPIHRDLRQDRRAGRCSAGADRGDVSCQSGG